MTMGAFMHAYLHMAAVIVLVGIDVRERKVALSSLTLNTHALLTPIHPSSRMCRTERHDAPGMGMMMLMHV